MKKFIILLILITSYNSYSDWELTKWRSDPDIKSVYPYGDTIIVVDEEPYISIDKGMTWQPLFEKSNQYSFTGTFKMNNIVYLISDSDGLLLSSDLGKTWISRNNGLPQYGISKIFTDGKNLFGTISGSINSGVYISTDLGKTWALKNHGLPNSEKLIINTIAFNKGNIYLGTWTGVYISTDLGENWISKSEGLPQFPYPIFFTFNDKNDIFVIIEGYQEVKHKFFVSKDGGNSWLEKENNINGGYYSMTFNSINDTIFIGANDELYMTEDFGDSWSKLTDIKNEDDWVISSIKISGSDIYVILSGDLFKSIDFGETWFEVKPKSLKYGVINSMVILNNRLVVAADRFFPNFNPPGIYSTTDLGESWEYTYPSVIYDKEENVWQTTLSVHNNIIFAGTNAGMFKSTDMGENWVEMYKERKLDANNFSFSGDTIFASADWGSGVFMSPDLGNSWLPLSNNGLPAYRILNNTMVGNQLFVNMSDKAGIFKTSDLGEKWLPVTSVNFHDELLLNLYSFKENLFIFVRKSGISDSSGVYFSSDLGDTWEFRSSGLPNSIRGVECFYVIGNTLIAWITSNNFDENGIYTTIDNGLNWIYHRQMTQNLNLQGFPITDFVHNDEYLFAAKSYGYSGSLGPAIYRTKLSDFGITDVKEEDNTKTQHLTIYPMPSSDYINITNIGYDEKVEIFDVLGNKVMDTKYNGKINISSLPIGVYFIHTGSQRTKFIKGN